MRFGEAAALKDHVLYLNKQELEAYLAEDEKIQSVELDIARPGESVRIVPAMGGAPHAERCSGQ